jgi:hypothetical protein
MLIYCVKCRQKTKTVNPKQDISKNNRPVIKGKCAICGILKNVFISKKQGSGVVNTILNKIPFPEMHLGLPIDVTCEQVPGGSFNSTGKYSYCGPYTKVDKRITEGYLGVNGLDKACRQHDLAYKVNKDTKNRNTADDVLALEAAKIVNDSNQPEYERKDARSVASIMSIKSRFGMGIKKKFQ